MIFIFWIMQTRVRSICYSETSMIFTLWTMQTIGLVHLLLWKPMIFIPWAMQNMVQSIFHFETKVIFILRKTQTRGQVHLPLWNLNICIRNFENLAEWDICRKYESSDYGPVHLLLWSLDDFHSLDNANSRSAPSATMKHRWFSFFGQPRLWVGSIYHFETYRFIIRNYENLAGWSFVRKLWFFATTVYNFQNLQVS